MNATHIDAHQCNLDAINPRNGHKYSPNLHQWLSKQPRPEQIQVIQNHEGRLIVGHLDEDIDGGHWIHGSSLMGVLCNGKKEQWFAYYRKKGSLIISDFWQRYERDGRCAIDTDHTMVFMTDSARWLTNGETRQCVWCGNFTQTLHRWTETVQREAWR